MKIRPVGAELFHADRQTDGERNGRDEANNRSSLFCERTKNGNSYKRLDNLKFIGLYIILIVEER